MKAVHFADRRLAVIDAPVPKPGPGQALIKTLAAGVCNTDLELFKGYMNFSGTPGHEAVGLAVEAPGAPELVGERVCCDINQGCGACSACLRGDARHCPNRTVLGILGWDGAFAAYFLAPIANLRRVPETVSNEAAVFAEPLAAALEIGQQIHLLANQRLLVLGDGKLGLLAACGLRHSCPGLVLAGRHPEKLAIAAAQGVTVRQVAPGADPLASLRAEYGLFDLVVEATGKPDGLGQALSLARPEGTVVAKTTSHEPSVIDLARFVVNEIVLVGSRCGDIGLALAFLKDGLVDVAPMIAARYPFSAFEEAFARACQPGALKVLIDFEES